MASHSDGSQSVAITSPLYAVMRTFANEQAVHTALTVSINALRAPHITDIVFVHRQTLGAARHPSTVKPPRTDAIAEVSILRNIPIRCRFVEKSTPVQYSGQWKWLFKNLGF